MAISNPISALSTMAKAITGAITYAREKRTFITLNGTNGSHTLSAAWVPAGLFEIEVDFTVDTVSTNNTLIALGQFMARVESDTTIRVWGNTAQSEALFTVPSLGAKLHRLKIKGDITSTSIELILDGTSQGSQTSGAVPNFTGTDYVFGLWSGRYFSGVIANIKLTDLTTVESNNLQFKLDEAVSDSELPTNNVFGSDEVVNKSFNDGSASWVTNSGGWSFADGKATLAGDGSFQPMTQQNVFTNNTLYEIKVIAEDISGSMDMRDSSGDVIMAITSGTNIIYRTADASTGIEFRRVTGTVSGSLLDVSIRTITNLLTYNNIAAGDREDFTSEPVVQARPELWAGQNFTVANTGILNTVTSGLVWDISSTAGQAGNTGNGVRINPFAGLTQGERYVYSVETDRPVNLVALNNGYALIANSAGTNSVEFTADSNTRLYVAPRDTQTVRVSNASVRLKKENKVNWLGPAIVPQPLNLTSGWTSAGTLTDLTTNSFESVGIGGQGVQFAMPNSPVQITFDVLNDGNLQIQDAVAGGGGPVIFAATSNSSIGTVVRSFVNDVVYLRHFDVDGITTTINSLKANKILEAP